MSETWRLPAEVNIGDLITCVCGEKHEVESFRTAGVPVIACHAAATLPRPYSPIYDQRRFTALFADETFVEVERTW